MKHTTLRYTLGRCVASLLLAVCAALTVSAQTPYTPQLVTPPADLKTVDMMATVTAVDFYGNSTTDMLSLKVGSRQGDVYIQGFCTDTPDAWIKGRINAAKDEITFAHGQYLGLFFGILDLYACGYKGSDTSKRCDFVLTRDTKQGTMVNKSGISFCTYYYDDYSTSANKYTPEQRYSDVRITPLEKWEPEGPGEEIVPDDPKVPVVVPDGVEFKPYTLSGTNIRTGHSVHAARLGFDGDDVYLADFCNVAIQTGTCIKGRRYDTRLVFPQDKFLATYGGSNDMYFYGASYHLGDQDIYMDNLTFEYDAMTDTYRADIGILITEGRVINGAVMNFSELLQDVVMIGSAPDGISLSPTDAATNATPTVYTLDGRRCPATDAGNTTTPHHGVNIERRPDGTTRKLLR